MAKVFSSVKYSYEITQYSGFTPSFKIKISDISFTMSMDWINIYKIKEILENNANKRKSNRDIEYYRNIGLKNISITDNYCIELNDEKYGSILVDLDNKIVVFRPNPWSSLPNIEEKKFNYWDIKPLFENLIEEFDNHYHNKN